MRRARGTCSRSRRGFGALRAVVLALAALTAPVPSAVVFADEPSKAELAAARQLFNEGKDLEKAGSWAEALEKFKKLAEVRMTPQVRFHIALCEENLGRLVSAINGFEKAAEEAKQAGAIATDVAENAPPRAEALRERVPYVNVIVKGDASKSRVLIDGVAIAPTLIGTKIPLDPGAHVIELETSGKVVQKKELSLAEKVVEEVELVVVEAAESAEPEPPPTTVAPPPAPPDAGLSLPPPLPAMIAGGVGIAALAGAGVFLGLRQQTIAEVRNTCNSRDKNCDPRKREVADRGETYTLVANVLLGAGGAALVAGGVLWLLLPSSPEPDAGNGTSRSLRVSPTAGGVVVHGAF